MSLSLYVAFTTLGGSCRVSAEDSEMEAEHVSSQTAQPWWPCLLTISTIQFHHRNSCEWCWKAGSRLLSIYKSVLLSLCLVRKWGENERWVFFKTNSLVIRSTSLQYHFLTGKDKTETADPQAVTQDDKILTTKKIHFKNLRLV